MRAWIHFHLYSIVFGLSGEWYYFGNNNDARYWVYVIYLGPVRFTLEINSKNTIEHWEDNQWKKQTT